jgi:Phage portal protein, SPP1 Gp6-like
VLVTTLDQEILEEVAELDTGLVPEDALDLVSKDLMPKFIMERRNLDRIDRWWRWDHDLAHRPRQATPEYRELIKLAPTPWLGLVVTELAQGLFVEGYRRANDTDNAGSWQWWQANRMDGRQMGIHRAALAYGISYATVTPGVDPLTDDPVPVIRGCSPRRGMAFYDDPAMDEWPEYFLQVDPVADGKWRVRLYTDQEIHRFTSDIGGGTLTHVGISVHAIGVCPVVRYTNMLDLEARADGEVDPYIAVAGRINQTVADRLIVQRFASWKVRTITGMVKPDDSSEADQAKMRLKIEDILIAEDPDTKFGVLPETGLTGFVEARDADIHDLAAVTQIPPYALLTGKMANLSADALAAASAGLTNKIIERQHGFGESHEQTLRLAAAVANDSAGARDVAAQVRWKDMGSRSLAQAADALGKLAQMLGVPVEMLWEQIPGWTDQDVQRAKELAKESGGMNALMAALTASTAPPSPPAPAPAIGSAA